jgi:hypothetical protein
MNQSFTHVLQKTGVLKTFTVAKVVNKEDIDELKSLIQSVAEDEAEYEKLLDEELKKLSNMHDSKNPIPGIIYTDSDSDRQKIMFGIAKKFNKSIKRYDFSPIELAFLVTAIINELGLSQEDFESLRAEMEDTDDDDDDDDDEDEDDGNENYV